MLRDNAAGLLATQSTIALHAVDSLQTRQLLVEVRRLARKPARIGLISGTSNSSSSRKSLACTPSSTSWLLVVAMSSATAAACASADA